MSGSKGKADSASLGSTFHTMVDRLVSQSTSGGATTDAVNDLITKFLAQEAAPVAAKAATVTTVSADSEPATATTEGTAATVATASTNGDRIVAIASRYLGTPYVWGGEDPSGFDCSGLIQYAYAEVGVDVPRVSRDQARAGVAIPNLDAAVPGDLVAFGTPVDHIGIYAGNGTMVVAPHTGDVVKVQRITREPVAIRRIVAADAPTPTPSTSAALGTLAEPPAAVADGGETSDPASKFRPLFKDAAGKYGVPASLLEAVAKQESRFDPTAVSPAGAQGLMQLMPATARALGVDAFDPAAAIDGAARLLSQHLRKFDSVPLALAAYNAGAGAVQRFNGIPPYRETQSYVAKIVADLANDAPVAIATNSATTTPAVSPTSVSSMADASLLQPFRTTPFLFNDARSRNAATPLSPAPTRRFDTLGRSNTGLFLDRLITPTPSPVSSLSTVSAVGTAPPSAPVASNPITTVASSTTPTASASGVAGVAAATPAAPAAPLKPIVGPGSEGWVMPTGKPESPAKGAWGPSTQTQVTSVGGEGTISWAASGLLGVASPADVTAFAPSATGPVAKGVLKILQNATPAQMISPEFRQTLNDVNRDALGLPNAPDVIPVQPPAPTAPPAAPALTTSGVPPAAPANSGAPAATSATTVTSALSTVPSLNANSLANSLAKPLTGANAVAPAVRTGSASLPPATPAAR